METLNMMGINVSKFAELIKEQLSFDDLTPVAGIGKSGIGKTESIYDITKELGIGFCELRLVTLTETELLGVPHITKEGRTTWASNDLLPNVKRDGERGILVLDEITSATPNIRAAVYQLLDSKRALGNYKLPDGWLVVCLGNGPDDGGYFGGMEAAFLSRCRCWRVEPELKSWKNWAVKNDVNGSIIAFLMAMPENLHKRDIDEGPTVFPCPRSWNSLSKMLNDREKRNKGKSLDQESVDIYTASCVGVEVAASFGAFYGYNRTIVSVEDILNGTAKTEIELIDTQVMYLIAQNLVRVLNQELKTGRLGIGDYKKETVEKVANACNWIVEVGKQSLDLSVMALTDINQNVEHFTDLVLQYEDFDEICPNLVEFAVENKIVFHMGGDGEE